MTRGGKEEKFEGKKPLGRTSRRWEEIIEMNLKEMVW
jgi:hypothetical protein